MARAISSDRRRTERGRAEFPGGATSSTVPVGHRLNLRYAAPRPCAYFSLLCSPSRSSRSGVRTRRSPRLRLIPFPIPSATIRRSRRPKAIRYRRAIPTIPFRMQELRSMRALPMPRPPSMLVRLSTPVRASTAEYPKAALATLALLGMPVRLLARTARTGRATTAAETASPVTPIRCFIVTKQAGSSFRRSARFAACEV